MTEPISTDDLEQELRAQLADLAATPDVASRAAGLDEALARNQHRLTSRRRLLVGAAASTAAVAGAATWRFTDHEADETDHVRAGTTTTAPTAPEPTGWEPTTKAPLSPRSSPAVVWAGDRLVVYGGDVQGMHPPDGAAWSPATRTWRPIANGPAGTVPGGFAVWDGTEVLVGLLDADGGAPWSGDTSEEDAPYGIAAYDPQGDGWRYVAPLSVGPVSRQAVIARGALVVAGRAVQPGARPVAQTIVRIDTVTGGIEPIAPGPFAASPYADASGTVALTTVGDLVVATTNWDLRPWVLDTATWTWRQVPAPDASSLHLLPAIPAGSAAFFEESDRRTGPLWVLDPTDEGADPWRATAPDPEPRARWDYEPVWSGRELFVPGAAYEPGTDTWRAVEPPPRGTDRQRSLLSMWADGALLLFGGEEYSCPDDAECDRQPGPDSLDGWTLADP
jgi:hypothetical protein